MNVAETLEALRAKALAAPALREALLATREHPDALTEFCRISTEAGFPIYDMDIIEYGEYAYASMKRSTNGGGENSPLLDGEDDAYEMFLFDLEQQAEKQSEQVLPQEAGAVVQKTDECSSDDPPVVPRTIKFDKATNFRDMGGYPAADGRCVKYGLFYRGGTLNDMKSVGDRSVLAQLGLKLVLDFRSAGERRVSPDYLPDGARYVAISAMRYENGDEVDFSPAGMERLEQEFAKRGKMSIVEDLMSYYARMPFDNPAFGELLGAMERDEVPLLFHCTSGKDRTGVGAMLLLLALGADRKTAVGDYMETNRCRAERFEMLERLEGELRETNLESWELRVIEFGVLQKFADAALDAILARYGAWETYFEKEYGLDEGRLLALREKYLE